MPVEQFIADAWKTGPVYFCQTNDAQGQPCGGVFVIRDTATANRLRALLYIPKAALRWSEPKTEGNAS